jgi:cytochrome c
MTVTIALLAAGLTAALTGTAVAQPGARTPLRNVAVDQVVQRIAYCRGEYRLTLASGEERPVRELNLRFKTDASTYGPERSKPVLLPAGMRGDRLQVIFADLDDLKRFLVERCEGPQR